VGSFYTLTQKFPNFKRRTEKRAGQLKKKGTETPGKGKTEEKKLSTHAEAGAPGGAAWNKENGGPAGEC